MGPALVHPPSNGARLCPKDQPQQLRKPKGPIAGARLHSGQNQRTEVLREVVEMSIELTLLLRKGERDRPGRPAARPAQQLPQPVELALVHPPSNGARLCP